MATKDSVGEQFETNDEICQKLIDEFVLKTDTDDILAQFYLQDRNWNLSLSLNDYFEHNSRPETKANKRSSDVIVVSSDEEDDCLLVGDSKKTKNQSLMTPPPEPKLVTDVKEFRFITWNIDGIDEKNVRIRTEAVCKYVRNEKALIVFLQEVIPQSESVIRESLPEYQFFSGMNRSVEYYTLTAIHKSYVKLESNEVSEYSNTIMGRNLLKTKV